MSKSRKGDFFSGVNPGTRRGDFFESGKDVREYEAQKATKERSIFQSPEYIYASIKDQLIGKTPEEINIIIDSQLGHFPEETRQSLKTKFQAESIREETKAQAEAMIIEKKEAEDRIAKINSDLEEYAPKEDASIVKQRLFMDNFDPQTGEISDEYKQLHEDYKTIEYLEKKKYMSRVSATSRTVGKWTDEAFPSFEFTKTSRLKRELEEREAELAKTPVGSLPRYYDFSPRKAENDKAQALHQIISNINTSKNPSKLFENLVSHYREADIKIENENRRKLREQAIEYNEKRKLRDSAREEYDEHTKFSVGKVFTQGAPGLAETAANLVLGAAKFVFKAAGEGGALIMEAFQEGISEEEEKELEEAQKRVDALAKPRAKEMFSDEIVEGFKESLRNINEENGFEEGHPKYLNPDEVPNTTKEFIDWVNSQPILMPRGAVDFEGGQIASNLNQLDGRLPVVKFNGSVQDYDEFRRVREIALRYKDVAQRIHTYTEEGGILDDFGMGGLGRTIQGLTSERIATLDIYNNMRNFSIINTAKEKGEDMNAIELAEAKSVISNLQSKGINDDFAFGVGQTMSASMVMMGEQAVIYGALRRIPGMSRLISTLLSGATSPSAFAEAADAYVSQAVLTKDSETGEDIVLPSAREQYDFAEKTKIYAQEVSNLLNASKGLEYEIYKLQEEIDKNRGLAEADVNLVLDLLEKEETLARANEILGTVLNDDGSLTTNEYSILRALIKGGISMSSEAFIERYGGAFLNKIGGRVRSLIISPSGPRNIVGRTIAKGDRAAASTKARLKNTRIGAGLNKTYNFLYKSSGSDRMIHGIWEEFGEEALQNLIPQLDEDWYDQIDEMRDSDFWATVALSTAGTIGMMNAGMKTIRNAQKIGISDSERAVNKARKDLAKKRKEALFNMLNSIDNNKVTDEFLDIVASVSPTSSADNNYVKGKVADLRNLSKEYKRADGSNMSVKDRIALSNQLESSLMVQAAIEAAATGETKKFQRTMYRVANNPNLDEHTRKAAREGIAFSEKITSILGQYEGRINAGTLRELNIKREVFSSIEDKNLAYREEYREEFINAVNELNEKREKSGLPIFTAEQVEEHLNSETHTLTKEELEDENTSREEIEFKEYFDSLSQMEGEKGEAVNSFEMGRFLAAATRDQIALIDNEIAWEESSKNLKEIEKREKQRAADELINLVTAENAEDIKRNLKEKGLDTPENIVAINSKVINQDNNPGIEEKKGPIKENFPEGTISEAEARERKSAGEIAKSKKVAEANKSLLEEVEKKKQPVAKPDSKVDQAEVDAAEQEGAPEVSQAEIAAVEAQRSREQQTSTSNQTEAEAEIAEIERIRREELENFSKGKFIMLITPRGTLSDHNLFDNTKGDVYVSRNNTFHSTGVTTADIRNDNKYKTAFKHFNSEGFTDTQIQEGIDNGKQFDKINDRHDAKYVEAVKKGEITKEQAMQALEEAGRKDSSAYAEIAALEETTAEKSEMSQEARDQMDIAESDEILFAPIERNEDSASQNNFVEVLTEELVNFLADHPKATFKGFLAGYSGDIGVVNAEQTFNLIAEAWENATETKFEVEELEAIYNEFFYTPSYFGKSQKIASGVASVPAIEPTPSQTDGAVIPKPEEIDMTDSSKEHSPKRLDTETGVVVDESFAVRDSRQFSDTAPKSGVLASTYIETEDGKQELSTDIREEAEPYMDYRNMKVGDEVQMIFDFGSLLEPGATMEIWSNLDAQYLEEGSEKPTRKSVSVEERLTRLFKGVKGLNSWAEIKAELERLNSISQLIAENKASEEDIKDMQESILFQNEEFLKIVPVGLQNRGYTDKTDSEGRPKKIIPGGMSDYYWFNNANVALKTAKQGDKTVLLTEERERRIQQNRDINLAIRQDILSSGSHKTTVVENRDAANNKLLPKDKNVFNSVLSQFGNDVDEFNKHAAIAYLDNGTLVGQVGNDGKKKAVQVNGVKITSENTPNLNATLKGILNSGKNGKKITSGRNLLIVRSGTNSKGEPTFTAHNIITNHEGIQDSAEKSSRMLSELFIALQDSNSDNRRERKAKRDLRKKFEKVFGYSLDNTDLQVLRGMFPFASPNNRLSSRRVEEIKKEIEEKNKELENSEESEALFLEIQKLEEILERNESGNNFRQDFKPRYHRKGSKYINLPNFDNFETIEEFLEALDTGDQNSLVKNGIEDMLRNYHTNLVFNPITNNGETIYTNGSQPIIIYDTTPVIKKNLEERERLSKENIERLEGTLETQEKLLEEATSAEEKRSLKNEIKNTKEALKRAKRSDSQLQLNKKIIESFEESSEIRVEEETVPEDYGIADIQDIMNRLLADTIGGLNITEEISLHDLYKRAELKYDDIINELRGKGRNREADFMSESRDEILGKQRKDGSIREYIELVLGIEEDTEVLDDTGEVAKQVGKSSFEMDARMSIRSKAKLMFFGIPDTRYGLGFAGFSSYLTPFEALEALQQIMSEGVNNNSLEDVNAAIDARVKTNPADLGFFNDIKRKLNEINETNPDIVNELLYTLYTPPVNMLFTMHTVNEEGEITLETYDANVRNPQIVKRNRWSEQIKLNGLLNLYGNGLFKVDPKKSKEAKSIHKRLTEKFESNGNRVDPSMRTDLINYLNLFGIRLNSITLDNLFQRNSQNDINLEGYLFGDRFAIINNLNNSLLYMESQEKMGRELGFINSPDKRGSVLKMNPVTFGNSKLNDLIKADNSVEFIPSSSNYLGGKTVNSRQQPNSLTTKIGNIKDALYTYGKALETDENAELPAELKAFASMAITSNSFLLERLKNSPLDMAKYFGHALISLEAIINRGSETRDDKSISELSDRDLFMTVFGQFISSEGPVVDMDFTEEYGISLRKGIIPFPTIADSGQMPLLKTILLDLTEDNINVEEERISDGVLRLMADQLLYPDLLRMADFNLKVGRNSSNISGYDVGSQFITGMSSLQFLELENEEGNKELLPLAFNKFLKTKEIQEEIDNLGIDQALPNIVREFIENHREPINNRINETLKQEADKVYEDFQREGLIDEKGKLKISDGKTQNSYSRKSARVSSYDFAINYALQQKEIQNIFAGDMAMYFSDKMSNGLKYGVPTIPMSELLEHFYPGEAAMETVKEILDGMSIETLTNPENKHDENVIEIKEELFESFPELRYADELIDSEADAMKAYETYLPLMRRKYNQIYKDVQNNLSKRLQGLISPGNKLANIKNQTDILQIMVSDMETISKTFMNLAESRYSEEVVSKLRPLVEEYHSLDKITHKNEIQKDRHKELGKEISELAPGIAAYLKTAETDAQEYMSWREALVQLQGQGRLPSGMLESITAKIENQSRELAEGKEISEENKLSERELEFFSGQPSKPLYAGTIISDINGHLANRFVYVKSSAFPLIPELTQLFPEFDKIRRNMEFLEDANPGKTVRISYQTANKVGAVKNAMSLEELHIPFAELEASDLEKKLAVVNSSSLILKREGHSIQQDVPSEYDKKERNTGTRATQFEKIILGDGISEITDNIFPAQSFDPELLSDLGIEVDEESGNINGQDLKNIYREIYKREQKILSDNLLAELDATSFEDIENGKVSTMEAYAEKINEKLTSKQDKEAIELLYQARNAQGRLVTMTKSELESSGLEAEKALFRFPIFMTPNSRKLESVMLSMVSKNNVNLTMPSFSSPVASERGFTYENYNRADFEKAKERGLVVSPNFDFEKGLTSTVREDGIRYAQVFVPNKFQTYNQETGRYELVDFSEYTKDGVIDLDKVPEDLLSMFSFRIPTSSHQSGMVVEVVGILPSTMRDLMVVPKDSTIQIGEDFDIDKRYVYQYNLVKDKSGNLKKMEYSDISKPKESYAKVKAEFEEEKDKLWREFYMFDATTGRARIKNPYLEANKAIIYELIWIEDAIENFVADRIIARVFDDFSPGEDYNSMSRESLIQLRNDLESKIIPYGVEKAKENELREKYREIKNFLVTKFKEENSPLKKSWENFNHYKKQKANELKVLENNLLALYKAVYSSDNADVHNLITKVLSTDFSERSAEAIDDKLSQEDEFFNINSFHTQRKVLALGADGKAGIGKHSNSVTLHSIFQQSDVPLTLFRQSKEVMPDKSVKTFRRAYNILLGEYIFTGELGKLKNERSGTRISEYLMESQNSATDNQKLEIMGRRNENPETMGVFSLLQMMGIEDSIISYKGNPTNISYASMFISQPAIIDIAQKARSKDSVTGEVFDNSGNIKAQLEHKLPDHVWMVNQETGEPMVGVLNSTVREEVGKSLSGQFLYDMIGKDINEMNQSEILAQHYIITTYRSLKGAARQLSDVQSIVNIENKGLGISMFDTIDLTQRIKRLANINIVPISELDSDMDQTKGSLVNELIGEVSDRKIDEDYIKVDDNFYIKPKTHFGHKIVNAVSLANGLIKPLFPYDSDLISQQIENIAEEAGIEKGTEEFMELQYDIINTMKDYSFSNIRSLFPGGLEAHRKDLFFDDRENNHKSLGSYILELREQSLTDPRLAKLLKLPLFRDMQIEVKDKTMPTIIKFNSDNLDNLSSTMSYNILKGLSKSDRKLPSRNGVEMTEASLLKEVFLYSLLADQANGAIGFRHLMPMDLFTDSKIDAIMRVRNSPNNYMAHINYGGTIRTIENFLGSKINNQGIIPSSINSKLTEEDLVALVANANRFVMATTGQEGAFSITNDMSVVYNYFYNNNESTSTFERQYFQHKPERVNNRISSSEIGEILRYNNFSFQDLMDGKTNNLVLRQDEKIAKGKYFVVDMGYEIRLYEKFDVTSPQGALEGSGEFHHYRRIPLLGSFGYNEYNAGINVNSSTIESNNFDTGWKATSIITNPSAVSEITLENVMKNLLNDKNNPYNELARVLSVFLPQIEGLTLNVKEGINGKGQYNLDTKTITISKEVADRNNPREVNNVVMEELLHATTTEIFSRYIEIDGLKEDGTLNVRSISQEALPSPLLTLLSVYNQALKHYSKKHGFEEMMNTIREINLRKKKEVSPGLESDAYRMSDINEFIAGIFIKDKAFSREMANTPYLSSGKSILQKFGEALARLFHRLLPEARKDSYSAAVADSLLNLLVLETKNKVPIRKSKVPSIKDKIDKLETLTNSVEDGPNVEDKSDIREGFTNESDYIDYIDNLVDEELRRRIESGEISEKDFYNLGLRMIVTDEIRDRINRENNNEDDLPSPCDGGPSM